MRKFSKNDKVKVVRGPNSYRGKIGKVKEINTVYDSFDQARCYYRVTFGKNLVSNCFYSYELTSSR